MEKITSEAYLFRKKCLLILLYLYYLNGIDYQDITFRSFGFHFDPTCNFKVIIVSEKEHIHKYTCHIFNSLRGVNLEELDLMGNVNIIHIKNLKTYDYFEPQSSINIYFDEANFVAVGYLEGKKVKYCLEDTSSNYQTDLLYSLNEDSKKRNIKDSSFILWLMRLYTARLPLSLVMGAGINCDYGAKDWKGLIDSLNKEFYCGENGLIDEIKHYAGDELFVSSKILNSNGFDIYHHLHDELYLFKEAKSFNDCDSTLYGCVDFIQKHPGISVITYNYDTNLEYLLRKRNLRYCTVFDANSFCTTDATVNIYHVHGLLPFDKYKEEKFTNSIIFNESEYFYLYNNPYSWNISKQMHDFTFNTCIFIGISMTDPNMKRLLELSKNYLKFNFIFLKKEQGFNEKIFKDVTNYFFTYDLITIWIDEYSEIGKWLNLIK
ncbi:MAG: SIR2 family protein [Erysipelotrichaceae bacterium]|nr:SIR2 family protein [Erysipelotrichaceae bacterium]MCB9500073.1 SIR2 family protein [Erysipelotrichaceae bacterium]